MGMYTELVMNVGLVDDLDPEIAALLKKMIEGYESDYAPPESVKNHPLFATDRWKFMLCTGSFYFVPSGNSKLIENDHGRIVRHVSIRTDLKNYGGEIEHFVDFIAPFVEFDGFAGYKRYEEDDDPTLLYIENRKAVWKTVKVKHA